MSENTPPKVFISYSWTSDDHADWVLELAIRLRNDGVETILDRWHLKPGQDKYKFMEQMVNDPTVQKVLMVCDRLYAEKADGRLGGVGDETQIISPEIYRDVDQKKFVPIIAEKNTDGQPYKPSYVTSRIHIDLSDSLKYESEYDKLLRDIFGKPEHIAPPVGQPPAFLMEEGKKRLPTTYKLISFKSALLNNKQTAAGLADDYLDQLITDLEGYNLKDRPTNAETFKDNLLQCIADSLPHRNEFIDFLILVGRYGSGPRLFASIQRFFDSAVKFIVPATTQAANARSFDPYRLIIPEYFLYTHAAFYKYGHYEAAEGLLSHTYVTGDPTDPRQVSGAYDYVVFSPYLDCLENEQNVCFPDIPGGTANLLLERANHLEIGRKDLLNADYVLYARHVLRPSEYRWDNWRGSMRGALAHAMQAVPFFSNARSRSGFAASKCVIGVDDKSDMLDRFNDYVLRSEKNPRYGFPTNNCEQDQLLMNIDFLDTQ